MLKNGTLPHTNRIIDIVTTLRAVLFQWQGAVYQRDKLVMHDNFNFVARRLFTSQVGQRECLIYLFFFKPASHFIHIILLTKWAEPRI